MSTKTIYKRIALVAVASLGAGLLSVIPANASGATVIADDLNLVTSGSTLVVSAATGADTAIARVGAQTIALTEVVAVVAADDYDLYVSTSADAAGITDANTVVLNTATAANVTDAEKSAVSLSAAAYNGIATAAKAVKVDTTAGTTASAVGTITFKTASLSAGTWNVFADATPAGTPTSGSIIVGTITVYDVGAPTTASYSAVGYTQIGSPANVNATVSVKDSSGRSTFLVGTEALVHSSTPLANATAPAIVGLAAIGNTTPGTPPTVTAGVFAGYTVAIPGAAGGQNVPDKDRLYTVSSQIRNGAVAYGSASVTYRNVDTTASIAGGSITFTGATSKAVVSSIATPASLQSVAADYVITVKDAAGALVKGAVPVATASTGTVSAAVGTTGDSGTDSTFRFTAPATAGTSTVTFSLSTGSTTLSTSVAFVTTTFGATAATTASVTSVKNTDGSGIVMTSTAPATNAWSAARNVTGITVTVGGLDASKAAKFTVGGTATGETIDKVATGGSIYPVASAAGVVTFGLALTSATDGQTVTVAMDAAGDTTDEVTLTITFNDTAATLTTDPKSGTLNMSTPSQTKPVTATLADQFANAITGGSFTLTNTVVPVGATAATAVTANADAAGKATLNAVLGATLGTYTFELKAFSANAAQAGSTSTISWSVTTTGIAGSLTLTDNDTVTTTATTTDDKGSRTVIIPLSAATTPVNVVVGAGTTDSATAIIVTSATPSGLSFTATATNGIRLFTTTPNSAALAAGKSVVTGTAGSSANLWAVPTQTGAGTITVVSGGLTKVYTLTGTAAAAASVKSAIITLTPSATNVGQYTVKASDALGNGVINDVAISLVGPGAFSNGFKNLTVTTGADGTNTFNVVSDGSAATTITAKLSATGNGAYVAITAAEATTHALALLGTLGASTDTATATLTGKGGNSDSATLAGITALIDALNAKIVALNALIAKIMRKLGVK
jgi:hypothetical protein